MTLAILPRKHAGNCTEAGTMAPSTTPSFAKAAAFESAENSSEFAKMQTSAMMGLAVNRRFCAQGRRKIRNWASSACV